MKTIKVRTSDEKLNELIDLTEKSSPVKEPEDFAAYLAFCELQEFRATGLAPEEITRTVAERDAAITTIKETCDGCGWNHNDCKNSKELSKCEFAKWHEMRATNEH